MGEVIYRSEIAIEGGRGAVRYATLPAESQPVVFGLHGSLADHYKVPAERNDPRASTLDYIVAATAGCLAGTFSGALEARGIRTRDGRLQSRATGEIEVEGGTLVIRRIHVSYRLKVEPDTDRAAVERVLSFHQQHCPVAKSIGGSVAISTDLELVD